MKKPLYLLLGLITLESIPALQAETSVTVPAQTLGSGQSKAFWASVSVTTDNGVIINSGGNLSLSAGQVITLNPGFRVTAGGIFSAKVQANASYDPGNFYGGGSPAVDLFEPKLLYGAKNTFVAPVTIVVSTPPANLLTNAPVLITIESAEGLIASNAQGTGAAKTLQLITGSDGTVSVYIKTSATGGNLTRFRVVAGGSSWTADAYALRDPLPDADQDTLSDATETALGTKTSVATQLGTAPALLVFNP